MEEQITQFLINLAPAIVDILAVIFLSMKVIGTVKTTSNEIRSDADIKSLVKENQELRKENKALIQVMREQNKESSKLRQEIQLQRRNHRR